MHAGAAAGALSIATTQPLDMVRIRMQMLASTSGRSMVAAAAATGAEGGVTAMTAAACARGGMGGGESLRILSGMIRSEGMLSPFKGMSFPLLSTALQVGGSCGDGQPWQPLATGYLCFIPCWSNKRKQPELVGESSDIRPVPDSLLDPHVHRARSSSRSTGRHYDS